jgi:Lipocalin-like domain
MPDQAALLGTWKMVSWLREVIATGQRIDVLGPDPVGYINYGADGRFYALVVSRDRALPSSLPPSTDEKLKLFDSMLAYAGTYTVDHEKAVHHVDVSWNEAWTGTDQVRFYNLDGHRLTISGAPAKDPHTGADVIYRIEFQKVSGNRPET